MQSLMAERRHKTRSPSLREASTPSFRAVLKKCFKYKHAVRGCFLNKRDASLNFPLEICFLFELPFLTEFTQDVCISGINHY